MRVSRCLPRATVATTGCPDRSVVASAGTRKSDAVSWPPDRAWSRCRAVRQTVSPSGAEPQPSWGGDETGRLERAPQRAGPVPDAEDVLAVGPFDGQPAQCSLAYGGGQCLDRGSDLAEVLGEGQQ